MSTIRSIAADNLYRWVDALLGRFRVLGPVAAKRGQNAFVPLDRSEELALDYCSTMTSPRCFIYPSVQQLFRIDRETNDYLTIDPSPAQTQLIFAIHPCDMHAIAVLDRTFLGTQKDFYYAKRRQETYTVVLNCDRACDKGFCSSMRTGPFLQLKDGFDVVMTPLDGEYLLEAGSERGQELIEAAPGVKKAGRMRRHEKSRLEQRATDSFTRSLDIDGLPELLMKTFEHPVYKEVADARCLGCSNCVLVCPTCFCYKVIDRVDFGPRIVERSRQWDACQDYGFAEVHSGNFRQPQQARLRQFMTHKLCTWVEQFGCIGCIGCGRCMTWCPTEIDITEMAKEIQRDPTRQLELG
jgi:sulfhydrogenase subunit beta (sulfur reductase)